MDTFRPSAKEAIIEAAFQLYREDPTASLGDIARRAGVGRATLHRYFGGRDELLVELAKTASRELDEAADEAAKDAKSYTEALELVMCAIVPMADRAWFLSREAALDSSDLKAEFERQSKEMAELIDAAKKEKTICSNLPTIWVNQVFDAMLFAAWEMIEQGEATEKQAADLAWRTFLNGVS